MISWLSTNWDLLAVLYCFIVLLLLPVSSERTGVVDMMLVFGAGFLLVSGFLRAVH